MEIIKLLDSFTDKYERCARVYPAVVMLLPLYISAFAYYDVHKVTWKDIGIGGVLVLASILAGAHLARSLGVALETKLKEKWGGLPTMRWIRPGNHSHSDEQKAVWVAALSKHSKLDVKQAVEKGSHSEEQLDKLINNAVATSRGELRKSTSIPAKFVFTTNIEYGFARNFGALRSLFLGLSILGFLFSLAGLRYGRGLAWPIVINAFLVLVAGYAFNSMEARVRHCSDRYAQAFYDAVVAATKTRTKTQ